MADEIFDRTYRSGRVQLHTDIDRTITAGLRNFAAGFARLNRIAWKAPWQTRRDTRSRHDRTGLA